jgi:hypothetical protein
MVGRKERASRVGFDMGYPARIVAIDGTWCRDCYLENISQTGAKIFLQGSVEGLNLKEFFLALSRTGTAFRRCRMVWLTGETMGVSFAVSKPDQNAARRRKAEPDAGC